MAFSTVPAPAAKALVGADIEALRKEILRANLLDRQQTQAGNKDKNSSTSTDTPNTNKKSQSTSSAPVAAPSVDDRYKSTESSTGSLAPLPTIDTSPMPYPSLATASRGVFATSSVSKIAPSASNGTSLDPSIEASSQGWIIGGLAWYWWLLILLAAATVGQRYIYQMRKRVAQAEVL